MLANCVPSADVPTLTSIPPTLPEAEVSTWTIMLTMRELAGNLIPEGPEVEDRQVTSWLMTTVPRAVDGPCLNSPVNVPADEDTFCATNRFVVTTEADTC